jgi:hypothetical protein
MKPSPKLRPTIWDGLVVLCVAALAVGVAFFQWRGGTTEALTAVVSVNGTEADRFAPADLLEAPRTYENNGYTLEVALSIDYEHPASSALPPSGESGLRVARSDCPTQDCVHTGTISRSGQSIVCLPARIIIRLEGGTPEDGGVDAILG